MLGYSSRGQIANRTGYLLQLIIPTFLRELSYGDNIDELQVDDDRHILSIRACDMTHRYCRYKKNHVYGYYLGEKETSFESCFVLSDVKAALQSFCSRTSQLSCSRVLAMMAKPELAAGVGAGHEAETQMDLMRICVVPRSVSERVGLMAVTKSNIRIYFLSEVKGAAPTAPRIIAIRLPPPAAPAVHACAQQGGTYLTINEDTSVTAYVRDFLYRPAETPAVFASAEGVMREGQVSRYVTQGYQEQCVVVKERGGQVVGVFAEAADRALSAAVSPVALPIAAVLQNRVAK